MLLLLRLFDSLVRPGLESHGHLLCQNIRQHMREVYALFYKSMSDDWEDHSPVKLWGETKEEYASFYKLMSGDWEDHSPVKLISETNEEYAPSYKSMSGDWEDHSPKYLRHFPWWIP